MRFNSKIIIVRAFFISVVAFIALSRPSYGDDARQAGDLGTITIKGIEYRFRWAPPGSFLWGYDSPSEIKFSYGFWILETETTQAMWKSIMNSNPSAFSPSGALREKVRGIDADDLPVESVSWNDCQRFVARLNELGVAPAGYRFSLPTWAQWHYTIDGGRKRSWDEYSNDRNNFNGESPFPVGYSHPNRWGIMDMRGNVAEFLQDRSDAGLLTSRDLTDPLGHRSSQGALTALGGGFHTNGDVTQPVSATDSFESVGFRLVLVPENPGGSSSEINHGPGSEEAIRTKIPY